jgi:hypothetical protein
MTRADLEGSTLIGDVVVFMDTVGPGTGSEGVGGCVRSKPCWEECSQKFEGDPMMALRCGPAGRVEDMFKVLGMVCSKSS